MFLYMFLCVSSMLFNVHPTQALELIVRYARARERLANKLRRMHAILADDEPPVNKLANKLRRMHAILADGVPPANNSSSSNNNEGGWLSRLLRRPPVCKQSPYRWRSSNTAY
ncbi:hypothetical protein T492DRAFT_839076 [Pavlovales sp. CCMP2436]|nr:hypothetical protein T492DRAFT_839076 [Pavlovales sp. CCMP2436]